MKDDYISRQAAMNAFAERVKRSNNSDFVSAPTWNNAVEIVENLPSAEPEWNNHTVACLLADMFGDSCACNFNGIDEWLPEKCDFRDTECPNPIGVACWEQFLKHKAERKTDG